MENGHKGLPKGFSTRSRLRNDLQGLPKLKNRKWRLNPKNDRRKPSHMIGKNPLIGENYNPNSLSFDRLSSKGANTTA